jgi:hypothetical protein
MSLKDLPAEKLPEDLRDWGSLKKYPTAADALRAHRELERAWDGRKETKPPGEGATPEEIAAWRKVIGAPEKPEDYGLKAPDNLPEGVKWNDDFAKSFAELAHKHHLPPAVVKELAEFHNANIAGMHKQAQEAQAQQAETVKGELAKAWGQDTGKNGAMAMRYAETLGLDPADPSIGNNAALIQALYKGADLMNRLTREPSGLITGQGPDMATSAQAAYDKITNSDDFKGVNGPEKAAAALQAAQRAFAALQKK